MSVSVDTSFEFSRGILYICVVIFRRKHIAKLLYKEILKRVGIRQIHVRKFDRKTKEKFFRVLDTILPSSQDDIKVRVIELLVPKGYNRFKNAWVERLITKMITIQKSKKRAQSPINSVKPDIAI